MGSWQRVADETGFGQARSFELGGKRVAVFHEGGTWYALDDICSHEYSLLSEGEIWDGEVYCPKHGSRFNLGSGAVTGLPATDPVGTWKVRVEDGGVFVEVP